MKVNRWFIALLILMGMGVGAISLYTASLSGVMGKMGLVGGDFSQSIDSNELARQLMSQNQDYNCNLWQVTKRVPLYLFSKGVDRVRIGGELGGERIVCGVKLVKEGNIERGVYTIIKGLYYLKTHYIETRILVEQDNANCNLLTEPVYERWVESYLNSTEGRVHEVVLDIYNQVENARGRVEELCTN